MKNVLEYGTDRFHILPMAKTTERERNGPGRPREFDTDKAAALAAEVFQARGYHGSSIEDLAEGTGLAKGSLYKAFGDKRGLFMAAFDHYADLRYGQVCRLRDAGAGKGARDVLREAMLFYAKLSSQPQGRKGCLVCSTATELASEDAEIAARVARSFERTRALLRGLIERGQAEGAVPAAVDAAVAARFLHCVIQGMRVTGKVGVSKQDMAGVVDQALRSLD